MNRNIIGLNVLLGFSALVTGCKGCGGSQSVDDLFPHHDAGGDASNVDPDPSVDNDGGPDQPDAPIVPPVDAAKPDARTDGGSDAAPVVDASSDASRDASNGDANVVGDAGASSDAATASDASLDAAPVTDAGVDASTQLGCNDIQRDTAFDALRVGDAGIASVHATYAEPSVDGGAPIVDVVVGINASTRAAGIAHQTGKAWNIEPFIGGYPWTFWSFAVETDPGTGRVYMSAMDPGGAGTGLLYVRDPQTATWTLVADRPAATAFSGIAFFHGAMTLFGHKPEQRNGTLQNVWKTWTKTATGWTEANVPNIGTSSSFRATQIQRTATRFYIAGYATDANGAALNPMQTSMYSYDGNTWTTHTLPALTHIYGIGEASDGQLLLSGIQQGSGSQTQLAFVQRASTWDSYVTTTGIFYFSSPLASGRWLMSGWNSVAGGSIVGILTPGSTPPVGYYPLPVSVDSVRGQTRLAADQYLFATGGNSTGPAAVYTATCR